MLDHRRWPATIPHWAVLSSGITSGSTNETASRLIDYVLTEKVPGVMKIYLSADKALCHNK